MVILQGLTSSFLVTQGYHRPAVSYVVLAANFQTSQPLVANFQTGLSFTANF